MILKPPRALIAAGLVVTFLSATIPAAWSEGAEFVLHALEWEDNLAYDRGVVAYEKDDYPSALRYWAPLAEKGYVRAIYGVAEMLYRGEGVPADPGRAIPMIERSAELGLAKAQYHLGFLLAKGEEIEPDRVRAYQWFSLAADQGSVDAAAVRDRIASQLTEAEIAEGRRLADEWKGRCEAQASKAAAGGRPRGLGVEPAVIRDSLVHPEYPELARVARLGGEVVIESLIDETGVVRNAKVASITRPNVGFEETSIDAVTQWRYEPARVCGEPKPVLFTVHVEFKLYDPWEEGQEARQAKKQKKAEKKAEKKKKKNENN